MFYAHFREVGKNLVLILVVGIIFISCECKPTLEIVNERNVPLTVFYDWNSASSFGVGAQSTESFNVGEEGSRTVRVSLFATTQVIIEENIVLDCKDTHTIIIPDMD